MNNSLRKRLESIEAGEIPREKSIQGEVMDLFFSSPEFSAGRLRSYTRYSSVKFSGKFQVSVGDRVKLYGKWVEHSKYGWQFEARTFEHDLKMDADGLAHYLNTNPNFSGIGPVKAGKIARAFAHNFDRVITETPEKIKQVAGLTEKQLNILRVEWQKRKNINSVSSWLGKFGLTHNQVEKLTAKYGNGVKAVLESDPYIIYKEIDGYGFYRADQIALKMGTNKNHPGRIQAAIIYTVDQQTQNGDCWTEERNLIKLVGKSLALDSLDWQEVVSEQLNILLKEKYPRLTAWHTSDRFLIADTEIFQREKELFEKFVTAAGDRLSLSPVEENEEIVECLTPSQRRAVHTALTNTTTVISGAAGSGKSFTLSTINQLCEESELSVALCAPTGKAAKRMEELSGKEAYTIHRLLNYHPQYGWQINCDNPLGVDVVIVDEFSMVDINLAWHLFDAIDLTRTRVILVGDHNQLPPVGPGNLLRDLLDRQLIPVVILNQVIRQAGTLKENSTAILGGQVRSTAPGTKGVLRPWYVCDYCREEKEILDELLETVKSRLGSLGIDPVRDLQVLTPWKKGLLGVNNLNIELQRLIQWTQFGVQVDPVAPNKRPTLLKGDKVMQVVNDYDLGIMNGSVGFVKDICPGKDENGKPCQVYRIDFDGRYVDIPVKSPKAKKLQLALATTTHKFQGSEIPCALVIAHSSQSFMLHRNWLYTAVTRARKTAIILGDKKGIEYAAWRQIVNKRKTFFSVLEIPFAQTGSIT